MPKVLSDSEIEGLKAWLCGARGEKLRAFSLLFASIVIKYLYYGLMCAL